MKPATSFTVGRLVKLRAAKESDRPWLAAFASDPEMSSRWRLGGRVPIGSSAFPKLEEGLLVLFVAERRRDSLPVGIVQAFQPDFINRVVHIGIAVDTELAGPGVSGEALMLLIDYVFAQWQFRKIYFTTPSDILGKVRGARRWVQTEGVLKDREFRRGALVDLHIQAIWREHWEQLKTRMSVWPTERE
jgi:hypothetical protein